MKQNNIFKLMLMGAGLLFLNACTDLVPVENPIDETIDNQGTRIEVLGLRTETDTKVTLTGTDFAWKEGDKIAVWTGTDAEHYGNYGGFQECTVAADGSLPVALAAGYARYNYALYPANIIYAGGKANFTRTGLMVILPDTYSYDDVCDDNVQQPMIAVNDKTQSTLMFYNLASMLRLTVTVPQGTVKVRVKFNPACQVNGEYYVGTNINPVEVGTSCIDSSQVYSPSNVISITGVHDIPVSGAITVNIPIPVGSTGYNDFSVSAWDSDDKALKGEIVHLASNYNATRGHGKQISVTLTQGAFQANTYNHVTSYCIFSPANLMYDGTKITFHSHDYDVCGSPTYSETGTFDKFAWGTSGYNDRVPWGTTYAPQGDIQSSKFDWGVYNVINSYKVRTWITPSSADWTAIKNNHTFATGTIGGVQGLIILPYAYAGPEIKKGRLVNYSENNLSIDDWTPIKNAGAVFLPYAKDAKDYYWSSYSKSDGNEKAYCLYTGTGSYGETAYYTMQVGEQDFTKKSSRLYVRLINYL